MDILILQVFKFNMNGIKWIYNKFVYRCLQIKVTAGLTKLRLLAVHVIVKLQFHEDSVLIIIAVSNHWLQIWIHWMQQHLSDIIRGCIFQVKQCQFHTIHIADLLILTVYKYWHIAFLSELCTQNLTNLERYIMYILMSKLDCYLPPKVQAIVKMALNVVETGKWHSY